MPINHTKKFLKSIHTVAFFWGLFSETLNFYFISVLVLIKMFINRKLLQRLISIYPRMPIVIREKWVWSKLDTLRRLGLDTNFILLCVSSEWITRAEMISVALASFNSWAAFSSDLRIEEPEMLGMSNSP